MFVAGTYSAASSMSTTEPPRDESGFPTPTGCIPLRRLPGAPCRQHPQGSRGRWGRPSGSRPARELLGPSVWRSLRRSLPSRSAPRSWFQWIANLARRTPAVTNGEDEDLEVLGSVVSATPSTADEETDECADDEVEEGQQRPIVPGCPIANRGFRPPRATQNFPTELQTRRSPLITQRAVSCSDCGGDDRIRTGE